MWWYIITGIIGLASVSATVYFWDDIRENVRDWLEEHDLEESAFMDILVKFDKFATFIRKRIFARRWNGSQVLVSEKTMSEGDIEDEEVRRELMMKKHAVRTLTM